MSATAPHVQPAAVPSPVHIYPLAITPSTLDVQPVSSPSVTTCHSTPVSDNQQVYTLTPSIPMDVQPVQDSSTPDVPPVPVSSLQTPAAVLPAQISDIRYEPDIRHEAPLDRARVVGSAHRATAWSQSADRVLVDWIRYGVPILFDRQPLIPQLRPNTFKSDAELQFARAEIETMVNLGALSRLGLLSDLNGTVAIWPLLCAPKAGPRRFRLVVNMSRLTPDVHSPAFKLDTLDTFLAMVRPGHLIWSHDLRDGYFHFLIRHVDRAWLGITLDGVVYCYNVLPFGLRSSPFVFTKAMRQPLSEIRALGVSAISYIDDFPACGKPADANRHMQAMLAVFDKYGLVEAADKRQQPSTAATILGVRVDTVHNRLSLPENKLSNTVSLARRVLALAQKPSHRVDASLLNSLLGKLAWLARVAPIVKVHARGLHVALATRMWSGRVRLDMVCRHSLRTIIEQAHHWNLRGSPIWSNGVAMFVTADASDTGWGASLFANGRAVHAINGTWSGEHLLWHINQQEMFAAYKAAVTFAPWLTGREVDFRVDSMVALSYLRRAGGRHPAMNQMAAAVHSCFYAYEVAATFQHIRGVVNVVSDALSRGLSATMFLSRTAADPDPDDWRLNPVVFKQLDERFGPHTVDRFARRATTQLPRFWSRFAEPGAEGINSLTADWSGENNWICCPFDMLHAVLGHVERCKAIATIVVPHWPNRPWWPLLLQLATDWIEIPVTAHSFLSDSGLPEPLRNPSWRILAVRVRA